MVCCKKGKKIEVHKLPTVPSLEVVGTPASKKQERPHKSSQSPLVTASVRSLRNVRSGSLFQGPRLTKLRALSAVVSRGEWHDEAHDKRFVKLDKQISDIELDIKEAAYQELMDLNETNPNDSEILWRLAKVCHGMSTIKGLMEDGDAKKRCVDEAVQHATRALELAPRSAEVHKWYAITIGSRTEYQPTKQKIKDGFVFKEHIEEAIKITPNDPTLLHLLGRFRFEVATLSWVERKIAGSLFGEVPYSTFPEALELLLKVEVLSKEPWKENRLIIAKCYFNMGEYAKGIEWLDNAYQVEPHSMEETRVHVEVQQLLDKYEKYRKKKK